VAIKFYFGGIAGEEFELEDRIRRGQLDGAVSGGMLCNRLAPSMRVLRVLGLFQNRDESAYVIARLKPILDKEFAAAGFVNIGEAGIGEDIVFSRQPVRTLEELRSGSYYIWDSDTVMQRQLPGLGVKFVPGPLPSAAGLYSSGKVDGFLTIPGAALAFQWSTQARYYSDLHLSFLVGCMIVAHRAFDAIPAEARPGFWAAAAKLQARIEAVTRAQDDALLGGLFDKQGLKAVHVDQSVRAQFFDAARKARERLGAELVAPELVRRVTGMLADFRAEHVR
jgi:TRAP-type C4-dicarboxylate transport system substrate-binding protein